MKFGFPLAYTVTILAWGGITFKSGYDAAGETGHFKESLKWATDYLIKAHKSKFELIGQVHFALISSRSECLLCCLVLCPHLLKAAFGKINVHVLILLYFALKIGDGDADHAYWGRPEDMTMNRPSFSITADKPGSDLAGETAAALAAASIYYGLVGENGLKNDCLNHAKDLFEFADTKRGKYSDSIPQASNFYK